MSRSVTMVPFWMIERDVEDGVVNALIREGSGTSPEVHAAAMRVQDQVNRENRGALRTTLIALKAKVSDRTEIVTAINTSLAMLDGMIVEPTTTGRSPRSRATSSQSSAVA